MCLSFAPVRNALVAVTVALIVAACSGGQPSTFSLAAASADPSYWCPGNVNNAPYEVHANVTAHNPTSSTVTIKAVGAVMTLVQTSGAWLERAGDSYDAGSATFAPTSVAARSTATIKLTFRSACTSPAYVVSGKGAASASYGDYRVTLTLTTSAGTYSISSRNLHRILAA